MENNRNGKTSVMVEHKTRIREIINLLRNENIVSEDYHIVLFLLSLYKDGLLPNENLYNGQLLSSRIELKLNREGNYYVKHYLEILELFKVEIDELKNSTYIKLYQIFEGIKKSELEEHFSCIFDEFLFEIRNFSTNLNPNREILQLINALIEKKDSIRVFNPFAGLASIGISLPIDSFYYGQEPNRETWALATLRLAAYNKLNNSSFDCDNSFSDWHTKSKKIDLIISIPPSGLREEGSVITKGLDLLEDHAQMIIIVQTRFLTRLRDDLSVRQKIVDADYLDTIIQLPKLLRAESNESLSVLVFNKNKKIAGKVRFIDARNFLVKQGRWKLQLDIKRLNAIVERKDFENSVVKFVDNHTIRENDYNLNLPRYFQPDIHGVKLKNILTMVPRANKNKPRVGKLITIRDLSATISEIVTDFAHVSETGLSNYGTTEINESCLLLATVGNSLKPTIFDYNGEPIYIRSEIMACKINDDIADITFVANELNSTSVLKQMESFNIGVHISSIRKSDVLELVIPLPSLQEQKAKVQGLIEASEENKYLRNLRNELVHGVAQKQFSEYASLKHTLGTPRQNILDWSNNLLQFFELKKEKLADLDDDFKDIFQIDMKNAVSIIRNDINFMTEVLERGEKGLVLSEYTLTNVRLVEIKDMIENLSSAGMKFNLVRDFDTNVDADDLSVTCNLTLLKILISNILTNADRHGFDNYSPANEVVISLYVDHTYLNLEIKNNGKPFPKNFGKEKFIEKFSKSGGSNGTGIGGNDIDRIATYFSSDHINTLKEFRRVLGKEYEDIGLDVWDLILNEDPIYPVIFKFSFNIWGTAMTL